MKKEASYIYPLVGTFEFIEVGRNKRTFTVDLNGEESLFRAIQPHLMSADLAYDYDAELKTGTVYAGVRQVGTFRRKQTPPDAGEERK